MLNLSNQTLSQMSDLALQAIGATTADTPLTARGEWAIKAALKHWDNSTLWDWTLSTATASSTPGEAFRMPADVKALYNVRFTDGTDWYTSYALSQRRLDRADIKHTYDIGKFSGTNEQGWPPYSYHLGLSYAVNDSGQGLLVPLPAVNRNATAGFTYYRHLTMPTYSSASVDIPAVYEDYIVAMASYRLLLNKGDRSDRMAEYRAYAMGGLAEAIKEHGKKPDEETILIPNSEDARLYIDWVNPTDYALGY